MCRASEKIGGIHCEHVATTVLANPEKVVQVVNAGVAAEFNTIPNHESIFTNANVCSVLLTTINEFYGNNIPDDVLPVINRANATLTGASNTTPVLISQPQRVGV